ncbi:hypothetical protein KBZ18_04885 [Synechococcus sp. Cruz-9H2]|uniref:hypothetical protein n=1 Tax=unclassified Synechococcus TaxID=2626047 RepID=UPI0020CD146D|nr:MULTISPECIES: hypothetical protein [unclassified Synechococcus]MCP9818826.1 hypothetical protein [Synechococcus sp. Cruz-9H2]MCP9843329.1 hypothetical protein [Synechococcus sp. Edmonson 11F2]MCP9855288.1 hypothetical protein [Synechococcus sp. Cruz-9C9]MCP9862738.1 hypothetical protein [Synechococcus sp. Cruz-7E5]MCP9869736.1 hypothetical protein [Synechococcus sp. Cruz-7B9]
MIAQHRPFPIRAVPVPALTAPTDHRAQLRLQSIAWALLAGATALALALVLGLGPALRAGGCGFFYGLLAFHLQRVDPDDSHLQAGLVGAVCGIRSLGTSPELPGLAELLGQGGPRLLPGLALDLLLVWLPLWLPLAGSALVLQALQRWLPPLRP